MGQFKQPKDLFFQLSLMEYKQWKALQRMFGDVANVYISCLDGQGHELMEASGDKDELEKLRQYLDAEQNSALLYRIRTSQMEDQIIEDTIYPNVKIAVISIKMADEVVLNWFVVGILSDCDTTGYVKEPVEGFSRMTTEKKFLEALDIIRVFTIYSLRKSARQVENEMANKKAGENERELSETIRRLETNADILALMDSEEPLEAILHQMMGTLSEYLDVTGSQLYRMRTDNELMDMIVEWIKEGVLTTYSRTQSIPKHQYFSE